MAEEATLNEQEGAAGAAPSPSPSKASGLELREVTKIFAGETVAVENINLHIDHGEYVVLLGPSGCGKTTLLRMIGGHEEPTSGEILLDGERLDGLPPDKRPTTTVFQHFALFPHRSVVDNVAFGLKMLGVGKEERRAKALETLEMVGLRELANRKPSALSGGQQQRVALARVLVTKPKALLLDEPLGDLDRLLQLRMRVELRNLQRQLGLMFIHVTHNQEEALSMADRIVVMNEAHIMQIGDPLTISTQPATEVVAAFMGDNNIFHGEVESREGDRVVIHEGRTKLSLRDADHELEVGSPVAVAVRAVAVKVADGAQSTDGVNQLRCTISFVEYLGDLVKLHLTSGEKPLLAKVDGSAYPALQGKEGDDISVFWEEEDVQLLER